MLPNVRVVDPTAHQKERALQASTRNNDLLGFDDHFALDRIVRVSSEVRVARRPDTLHTTGYSFAALLVEEDSVYFVSLQERGACLGCIWEPGFRGTLFASGMTTHRAVSTVVFAIPGVLGHGLGGITQFACTFKNDSVAVVVLDVRGYAHPPTDAIQRLLEFQGRKER